MASDLPSSTVVAAAAEEGPGEDDFSQIYNQGYVRPGQEPTPKRVEARDDQGTAGDVEVERHDPNEIPTDFTSKYSKVWDAKAKAAERNWKRRREDELTCKLCGELGHPTQGCPSTLGASKKPLPFAQKQPAGVSEVGGQDEPPASQPSAAIKVGDRRLRARVIGSGGVVVQGLEKQTRCRIKIEDDTTGGGSGFVIKISAAEKGRVSAGEKVVRDYVLSLQAEARERRVVAAAAAVADAGGAGGGGGGIGGGVIGGMYGYPDYESAAAAAAGGGDMATLPAAFGGYPSPFFPGDANGGPAGAAAATAAAEMAAYQAAYDYSYGTAAAAPGGGGGGGGGAAVGAVGGAQQQQQQQEEQDPALQAIAAQLEAQRQATRGGTVQAEETAWLPESEEDLESQCAEEIRSLLRAQVEEELGEKQRHEQAMRSIGRRFEMELMQARGKHERMRARYAEREAEREREEEEKRRREEAEQRHAAYMVSLQQQQQQALQQQAGYGTAPSYPPSSSAYGYNGIADAAAAAAGGAAGSYVTASYGGASGVPAGGLGFQEQQQAQSLFSQGGTTGGVAAVSGFSSAPHPQHPHNPAPPLAYPSPIPQAQPYPAPDNRYGHYSHTPKQQVEQQFYPRPGPPEAHPHTYPPFAGGSAQGGMSAMYAVHGWQGR